jgi:hypothetical protein
MIGSSANCTRIGSHFSPLPGQLRIAVFASSAGVSPASGLCHALAGAGAYVLLFGSSGVSPYQLGEIADFDVVLKFSGCGDSDREIEEMLLDRCAGSASVVFVDADVPGNLRDITEAARAAGNGAGSASDRGHFRRALIPRFDAVLITSGGPTACDAYESLGARRTGTLYPALGSNDCAPTFTDEHMECDLLFAGDRDADTDPGVRELFFTTAAIRPDCRFILAGKGWSGVELPENVQYIGPLTAKNRAEAYSSARFVLSIAPESAKEYGFCPTAGLFEAASSGACVISDSWPGIGTFFKPDWEILVAQSAQDMSIYLDAMYGHTAARIGNRAWERIMADHTPDARARDLLALVHELRASLVMA